MVISLESGVTIGFLAIYVLSGFSALLYQVVWQRMLTIFSGSDLYATTTIVAAFMAGLGVGSLAGGAIADRVTLRGQIRFFATAELCIGAFALVSKWWYYDVLYVRHGALAQSPVTLAAVLFGSLLIPTFCMGVSFPLISKAFTPSVEEAGSRIGLLYAGNTFGAAAGAFAAAWFFLGNLAFPEVLWLGAAINFVVAVLALILGPKLRSRSASPAAASRAATVRSSRPKKGRAALSFNQWLWIYALSGFVALSLEIVWFRLLGVMLKSNSFTFPHVLAIYLASLALGIAGGAFMVRRSVRADQVCLGLLAGVSAAAALSLVLLLWASESGLAVSGLEAYLGGYESFDVAPIRQAIQEALTSPLRLLRIVTASSPSFASLYLAVPLAVVALPSLLMGLSFPFLQRAVQDSPEEVGRRVGWLQAANILGATLGAVVAGPVFLHHAGVSWTLRGLVALGGAFVFLWVSRIARSRVRRHTYMAATAALAWLIWLVPEGSELWARLHGATPENVLVAEDGSGVSVLKNTADGFAGATVVYVNGLGQSWIPFGGVHSQLGIIPALLHPNPREVAVIGLGSGDTAYSLGGREATHTITCIEIIAAQLDTLRQLQDRKPYGGLEGLLTDTRFGFAFTDGRSYLARSDRQFDVIEADALRPNSAFAGNLYSYEYFLLLRSRLKPGGLAVTWAPTPRVVATFARAFPHVFQIDSILVGSADPIPYDSDVIRARLEHPFTQNHYSRAGINVNLLAAPLLDRSREDLTLDSGVPAADDLNTDLHPKDEYGL
ncbi:MAG TPA: fused MFS/spermidine synthase [Terriglobia bacterium]|nr:fused MFS/spermidine synthase [Terriglobia bacterium]